MLAARLRNCWIMAPTPSTRHLLDGVEVPVPPLDGASTAAFSTAHPTHCLIYAQVTTCKCGKPVTFEAVPCGCRLACDKCAMKLASGGKCRHCKEWDGGLRRISGGVPSQER